MTMGHLLRTTTSGCLPSSGGPVSILETEQPVINHSYGGEEASGGPASPSPLSISGTHNCSPPPRERLCRPMIPPQMLLKPQSNTFNSPRWHCPSGWQSHPGQADPAKMRLLAGWGGGQCVLAWKAHGSLLPRVTHLSSWALSLCVSPRNSQDTPYPTVSQCLHQDTLWPRGIAMCCYMQVYPLAFADLGSRGGGYHG